MASHTLAISLFCIVMYGMNTGAGATSDAKTAQPHPNNTCTIYPTDSNLPSNIITILAKAPEMVEYKLNFTGYGYPLTKGRTWNYNFHIWRRVFSKHGQTLLSLPFNFKFLSLSFLGVGIRYVNVPLQDSPAGCFGRLTEEHKMNLIVEAISRDFKRTADIGRKFDAEDLACHQVIRNQDNVAVFTHECCQLASNVTDLTCHDLVRNKWINLLYTLIHLMDILFLLLGPLVGVSCLSGRSRKRKQYFIHLEQPVIKTVKKQKQHLNPEMQREDNVLIDDDVESTTEELCAEIAPLPYDREVRVSMETYAISVDHMKLMDEKNVNVGPVAFLWQNLVLCKLMKFEPFLTCCGQSICGSWSGSFAGCNIPNNACSDRTKQSDSVLTWSLIGRLIGAALGILIIPVPFYFRFLIFKASEEKELQHRQEAAENVNMAVEDNENAIELQSQYSMVFIHSIAFVVYFITSTMILIIVSRNQIKFQHFTTDVISDFKSINRLESFRLLAYHVLEPFEKFGICGILIAPLYWLIALPICLLLIAFYCVPTFYLTGRLLVQSRPECCDNPGRLCNSPQDYERQQMTPGSIEKFTPLSKISPVPKAAPLPKHKEKLVRYGKIAHLFVGIVIIVWMYSLLLLYSECFGLFIEMATLTLMGAAVYSGVAGKFLMLMFFVVVYTSTCFKRVTDKYQKLNSKIFEFIKNKLHTEVNKVVKMRGSQQQNVAFKYFSTAEVRKHIKSKSHGKTRGLHSNTDLQLYEGSVVEVPQSYSDEFLSFGETLHLNLHSVIFFIDNDDVPRIPKDLFDEIAQMKCPGCPGPVHRSLLSAARDLIAMILFLCFIVIVVMAFGDAYNITTTNQMLLTLAGGLLPFIFKEVLKPNNPDLKLNSYTIDGKIHEIIQDFHQTWPVSDIIFKPKAINPCYVDANLPNIHLGPVENLSKFNSRPKETITPEKVGDIKVQSIETNSMGIDLVFNVNDEEDNVSKETSF